jgi:hypothetical protein
VIAMLGTSIASVWRGEDSDCNKGADKQEIEKHKQPTEPSRAASLEEKRQEHGQQGVKHCSCEDALDGTVGAVDPLTSLDRVDQSVHLSEASGEDAERNNRRYELQDAGKAKYPAVQGGVFQPIRDKAGEEASVAAGFAVDGTIIVGLRVGVVVVGHGLRKMMVIFFPKDD